MKQNSVIWPQIVAGLAACGGAFVIGTALGWSAPAATRLDLSQSQFNTIASILNIGCAVSCLLIGILMKTIGRKWSMICLVIPFVVGWSLVTWAHSFWMLLIGRFMIGLAGGAFCVSAPQYSAEITESKIRGAVGTFCVTMINAGIVFVYIIGTYIDILWTNIICLIIPLVFTAILFFMPESPVYLLSQKRDKETLKVYKWLRGENYDANDEVQDLKLELEKNQNRNISMREVLKKKTTQRALLIGFGLMFFQQMSGINAVIFYSTFIFKEAKTGMEEELQTIVVGAVLFLSCFAGIFIVDRLGRKILLLISSFFMTLMLTILGIYFYLIESKPDSVENLGWLPLTSLCIFLVAFSIGFGPLPWLLISEIYSKDYNIVASPLNGCFTWLLAYLVTQTFGSVQEALGIGSTFMIFAGFCFLAMIFVYFVVIETKSKTMAEIQRALAGK